MNDDTPRPLACRFGWHWWRVDVPRNWRVCVRCGDTAPRRGA